MKIKFICHCGWDNQNLNDWTCHWRWSKGFKEKLHAIKLFLLTRITLEK